MDNMISPRGNPRMIKARKLKALAAMVTHAEKLHILAAALSDFGNDDDAHTLNKIAWSIGDAFDKIEVPDIRL